MAVSSLEPQPDGPAAISHALPTGRSLYQLTHTCSAPPMPVSSLRSSFSRQPMKTVAAGCALTRTAVHAKAHCGRHFHTCNASQQYCTYV